MLHWRAVSRAWPARIALKYPSSAAGPLIVIGALTVTVAPSPLALRNGMIASGHFSATSPMCGLVKIPPAACGVTGATCNGAGAAAALERLEAQEEESRRRLVAALERGNPLEIDAAQTFWLKCYETLRRLI